MNASQNVNLNTRVGRGWMGDFRGGGISAGRLGDGGGEEKRRWLKLKREEVADRGTFSHFEEPV